ncbi:MAG: 23S rRNA (pseudouridine(1915)-N(3))-methyltransferase RlmH [Syntrophomonadaceae bacterium]|nr:23S rRNA (pseudouridine(1915)-N(3))-methyltransferase RlmH [Syntrophomonadaceae bacterium]
MKLKIISVGKIREPYIKEGITEYLNRLRSYTSLEFIEGLEEKTPPNPTETQINSVLAREGNRVLSLIRENDYLVALDYRGKAPDSVAMAGMVTDWMNQGISTVVFVIGASHGLAPEVMQRANYKLSLSNLTFLHQMTALILLEQLYRSFKIIRGEPYHK